MADDQQQGRGDSRAAARVRRAQQREEWERSQGAHALQPAASAQRRLAGTGHITEEFANALGALLDAAARLPVCDRAAKLHAGLHRIVDAADAAQAEAGARSLVDASQRALRDDPWMRFHEAALHLAASLERYGATAQRR